MADMIPAKGEGAADELPMPSDGLVAAHLVLGPPQSMFDLFVALLVPHAQSVESDHLFQTGWREWWVVPSACACGRQVGDQVPGGDVGQCLEFVGGHAGEF